MSVFVNLKISANRSSNTLARFESSTNGDSIIENPSEYSVGINRFKIPLGSVPIYRIYDESFAIQHIITGNQCGLQIGTNLKKMTYEPIESFRNVVDLSSINVKEYGRYGIDSVNNAKKYLDIYSQSDWLKFLNMCLVRSFVNSFDGATSGASEFISGRRVYTSTITNLELGKGSLFNPATPTTTFDGITTSVLNITADTTTDGNYNGGSFITGFQLNIGAFTSNIGIGTNAPKTIDWGDYQIELLKESLDATRLANGDKNLYVIKTFGKLKGLSSNALSPEGDIHFGFQNGSTIDCEEMADATLYNAYVGTGGTTRGFQLFPTGMGGNDFLGKRADGYKYTIRFINRYARNFGDANVANNIPSITLGTGGFLQLTTQRYDGSLKSEINIDITNVAQNQSQLSAPNFEMDDDGKLTYIQNNYFSSIYGMNLYINTALNSLLTLTEYESRKYTNLNISDIYDISSALTTNDLKNKLAGSLLSFSPKLGLVENGSQITLGSDVSYPEAVNSKFSRDWLNGILITTGRLAVNGEISGDGGQKRKVLTDFEIDPSSVGRDYLVFTNSGGMRLYGLNSATPIKEIDAQVSFQDIYGFIRPLTILPFESCSMKIEFRPNSQLYSSQQSISSFDF